MVTGLDNCGKHRSVGEDKELGFGGVEFAVSVGQSSGDG